MLEINKLHTVDLTQGSVFWRLLQFSMPLLLGNIFQQFYNTVDFLVVGNFCGSASLAAVSSSTSIVNLFIGASQGFAIGSGVVISRYLGAKLQQEMRRSIHTIVVVGALLGSIITIFSQIMSRTILIWMDTPITVLPESTEYFRIFSFGLFFMVMYNIGSGILHAVGDSLMPLYYLIISTLLNIVLDIVLVAVFDMGIRGVALATVIAQAVSVLLEFAYLFWVRTAYQLRICELQIHREQLISIMQNALPSSLQNCIVAMSNVVVQANVNVFGELAMAGFGSYNKLGSFAVLPATSMSMTLTTFISQNLGAKQYDRVRRGVRLGLLFTCAITMLIGGGIVIFAPELIALFNSEPDVIRYGTMMAYRVAPFLFLLGLSHALTGTLRGAGLAKVPMIVLTVFWCGLRILWMSVLSHIWQDIRVVFWAYPITWLGSTLVIYWYSKNRDWLHKENLS